MQYHVRVEYCVAWCFDFPDLFKCVSLFFVILLHFLQYQYFDCMDFVCLSYIKRTAQFY